MDYLRHPYLWGLFGGAVVLVIGAVIVASRLPAASTGQVSDFGTHLDAAPRYSASPYASTPQIAPSSAPSAQQSPDTIINQQIFSSFNYDTAPATSTAAAIISTDSAFDFNAFMRQLSGPKTSSPRQTTQVSDVVSQDAYPPVPVQLFSATEPTAPARNSAQQALYMYGNAAGSFIQSYEQTHPNAVVVVQKYFDARANAANTIALKQLAADLKNIGSSLRAIQDVPASVEPIHNALANSYIDVGDKLASQVLPQTRDDIIKTILSYDDAVETYVKNYNALAQALSQYGITFNTNEPGSMFMFSQ